MDCVTVHIEGRRAWREFLDLPRRIYRHDPVWVPTLDTETRRALDERHNPYFRDARLGVFGCYRDGRIVARTAAVVNPAYRGSGGGLPALFGFFESEDDADAVGCLFASTARWCADLGATSLHGPFQPHHYSELGLQVAGFEKPVTFFQTHHRPYYLRLLEGNGFTVEQTVFTARNPDIRKTLCEQCDVGLDMAKVLPGLTVRSVDLRDLPNELARIREVYNDAFSANRWFLPVSLDEYLYSASSLKLVTRPDLNVIVEHDTEPVGVLQCMLDVNPLIRPMRSGRPTPIGLVRFLLLRRTIPTLVVYAVGIKRRWQRSRVHVLLFNELRRMAVGFTALETTWMSPENPLAVQAAERFGMKPDRTFAILTRPLAASRPAPEPGATP